MSTRSILGFIYTLRGLRELGEDVSPVLARYGLDLERLDPGARLERSLELRIYIELAQYLKDPLAGLKTGTFFGFTGYGPLTMLLMTCRDAYEAFQTGVRYQQLTFLFSRLSLEPGASTSALVLSPLALPEKAFRFRVDGEASGTYKLIQDMQAAMGLSMQAEAIYLPYPRPPEATAYEAHYQCPVHFNESPDIRCVMRNEYLHVHFPTADSAAHALFRQQCDALIQQIENSATEGLPEKVAAYLALFGSGFPSAPEVARAFDIPERSFRRQLSQAQQSFRGLLESVRRRKAEEFLNDSRLSVEAIARQLGYAEAAAFIHAFQRWTGQTPAAFRSQQKAQR